MVANYVPDRGDLVWVDFNPQRGHEQAHTRPALVLSPKSYNRKSGLMLACPITSQVKGYPFEVALRGAKTSGVVLADQVRALDWKARHVRRIERVSSAVVQEVQAMLIALLTE